MNRRQLYLTLSGSVTVKLRSAEQAVSMLGSLVNAPPLFPLREVQHCDRKSTSRAGVSRVSSTLRGPSSADRWHRAGRRYLKRAGQDASSDDYRMKAFLMSLLCLIVFTSELLCPSTTPSPL